MNKRIQKLAEQATETFTTYFDGRGNVTETYFDKQKFAELIIRECAGVAEISMPVNSYSDDRLVVKNSVLEHFGVEE